VRGEELLPGYLNLYRNGELARRIERLDAEIDALVYELYGLTEEIEVVEGLDHE